MRVTCAISSVKFEVPGFTRVNIPHSQGYFHPVFALKQKQLYTLYRLHCTGELTDTDSYLVFLALLHSSGKIEWNHPATRNPNDPNTKKLVQNNIAQLIRVVEKTALIKHPGFKQPEYRVNLHNSSLETLPNFIKAWEENIIFFNQKRATIRARQELLEIENRLSALINSGVSPEKYAYLVANWAREAGDFPPDKAELWTKTIRSCFNIDKMFKTPLSLLKEIKDYCECNIEAGSLYFHALSEALKEGISKHVDYLGGGSLALGYTILPNFSTGSSLEDAKKQEEMKQKLEELSLTAPEVPPNKYDYPDTLSYVKAKMAFRIAQNIKKKEQEEKEAEARREQLARITEKLNEEKHND